MRRADRVLAIHGIAKSQERELAQALARARDELRLEEAKLGRLQGYLSDYRSPGPASKTVTRPALLRERRGFLTRLEDALREQQQCVAASRNRAETLAARWRESRSHLNALEKAAERLRAEEARRDQRTEQAATDETSLNMTAFSRR